MTSPETLPRAELVGLAVRVVDASNPALVGIEGRVVDETMRTLSVEDTGERGASRVRQVPKDAATFEFRLPGPGADPAYVTVDGEVLVARPARRTERRGDSTWR